MLPTVFFKHGPYHDVLLGRNIEEDCSSEPVADPAGGSNRNRGD